MIIFMLFLAYLGSNRIRLGRYKRRKTATHSHRRSSCSCLRSISIPHF